MKTFDERDFDSWLWTTACGGGKCEWAEGSWLLCALHSREMAERQPSGATPVSEMAVVA